jgi:hypothetical protein
MPGDNCATFYGSTDLFPNQVVEGNGAQGRGAPFQVFNILACSGTPRLLAEFQAFCAQCPTCEALDSVDIDAWANLTFHEPAGIAIHGRLPDDPSSNPSQRRHFRSSARFLLASAAAGRLLPLALPAPDLVKTSLREQLAKMT